MWRFYLAFVESAHVLQQDARWVVFTDGAAEMLPEGRVAAWAFAVLERVGASFQFAGARSGKVYELDCHPWFLGTDAPSNNAGGN